MSAGLRVFGFGYQISKPIIEYPSGLKSYPCPYPRVQNTTESTPSGSDIRGFAGIFVPVDIFTYDIE